MWENIGTALLSGSVGFVAGAWWIVKYKPAPGVDLDAEDDGPPDWDELREYAAADVAMTARIFAVPAAEPNVAIGHDAVGTAVPVTHLIVGGNTACCLRRATALPWCDLVTAHPDLVTCTGGGR